MDFEFERLAKTLFSMTRIKTPYFPITLKRDAYQIDNFNNFYVAKLAPFSTSRAAAKRRTPGD